jgi:hypothetical protein
VLADRSVNEFGFSVQGVDAEISITGRKLERVFPAVVHFEGWDLREFHWSDCIQRSRHNCLAFYLFLPLSRFLHLLLLWRGVPRETFTCSAFPGLIPASSQHSIRLATYARRLPCQCSRSITDRHFDYITNG